MFVAAFYAKVLHESLSRVNDVLQATTAGAADHRLLLDWLCKCVEWIYSMFEGEPSATETLVPPAVASNEAVAVWF